MEGQKKIVIGRKGYPAIAALHINPVPYPLSLDCAGTRRNCNNDPAVTRHLSCISPSDWSFTASRLPSSNPAQAREVQAETGRKLA